jgi:hypothetical protein
VTQPNYANVLSLYESKQIPGEYRLYDAVQKAPVAVNMLMPASQSLLNYESGLFTDPDCSSDSSEEKKFHAGKVFEATHF